MAAAAARLLAATTSGDAATRARGEAGLVSLKNRPGFAACLLSVCDSGDADLQARMAAAMYLKTEVGGKPCTLPTTEVDSIAGGLARWLVRDGPPQPAPLARQMTALGAELLFSHRRLWPRLLGGLSRCMAGKAPIQSAIRAVHVLRDLSSALAGHTRRRASAWRPLDTAGLSRASGITLSNLLVFWKLSVSRTLSGFRAISSGDSTGVGVLTRVVQAAEVSSTALMHLLPHAVSPSLLREGTSAVGEALTAMAPLFTALQDRARKMKCQNKISAALLGGVTAVVAHLVLCLDGVSRESRGALGPVAPRVFSALARIAGAWSDEGGGDEKNNSSDAEAATAESLLLLAPCARALPAGSQRDAAVSKLAKSIILRFFRLSSSEARLWASEPETLWRHFETRSAAHRVRPAAGRLFETLCQHFDAPVTQAVAEILTKIKGGGDDVVDLTAALYHAIGARPAMLLKALETRGVSFKNVLFCRLVRDAEAACSVASGAYAMRFRGTRALHLLSRSIWRDVDRFDDDMWRAGMCGVARVLSRGDADFVVRLTAVDTLWTLLTKRKRIKPRPPDAATPGAAVYSQAVRGLLLLYREAKSMDARREVTMAMRLTLESLRGAEVTALVRATGLGAGLVGLCRLVASQGQGVLAADLFDAIGVMGKKMGAASTALHDVLRPLLAGAMRGVAAGPAIRLLSTLMAACSQGATRAPLALARPLMPAVMRAAAQKTDYINETETSEVKAAVNAALTWTRMAPSPAAIAAPARSACALFSRLHACCFRDVGAYLGRINATPLFEQRFSDESPLLSVSKPLGLWLEAVAARAPVAAVREWIGSALALSLGYIHEVETNGPGTPHSETARARIALKTHAERLTATMAGPFVVLSRRDGGREAVADVARHVAQQIGAHPSAVSASLQTTVQRINKAESALSPSS